MAKKIVIDPVTRIEGHAKITIQLDDAGKVDDAQFHVTQFRGFEKFVEGRPFEEMPSITARICGICPVSHLSASAKACDALIAVSVPPTGEKLRKLFNLAQYVQSHALSFFHLTSPDLLLGMDAAVKKRNVLGVAAEFPEVAKEGIWLRKFGQQLLEWLSEKRIHAMWMVPGGVSRPFKAEYRDEALKHIPRTIDITQRTTELLKSMVGQFEAEIESFGNFPSMFMGLVSPEGNIEHTTGKLRFVDENRNIIADQVPAAAYSEFIGEAVLPYSYLKTPYYLPMGYPDGFYRVGPLARLNVCDRCGTPLADEELKTFRSMGNEKGAVWSSFHFHYARLIEILHALERIEILLNDPDILDEHVRAHAAPNCEEGVGISEAPRGTLIHHYRIDPKTGLMKWANLIVATGHNNMAMNRGVRDVAKRFVDGNEIKEGALNRVEALIRCYDPCLSCSTHALGQMPMLMEVRDRSGALVNSIRRD